MAKKKAPKKTLLKKGFKKVQTRRASNTVHFEGTTKRMKDPDNIPDSTIRYHLYKNRKRAGTVVKGTEDKNPRLYGTEPISMVLILKINRADGGPRKTLSLVTPPDMVINQKNVKKFIKENLDDLEGNIEEKFQGRYEDTLNTERINDYSIKFIY